MVALSPKDQAAAGRARGPHPMATPATSDPARWKPTWGKRLPLIRQNEAAECGLACLAMIAGYYSQHHSMPALRQRFSSSLKGMDLTQLLAVGQALALVGRPFSLELDDLAEQETPCILHWDMNHFVVLRKVIKRGVIVHDPAAGQRYLTWDELGKHLTGVAIEFHPAPEFQTKEAEPTVPLRTLTGSVSGFRRGLLTIFGLALVLELFGLLAPQLMQLIVDQVLADGDRSLLTILGLSFGLLLVWQIAISTLRSWTVIQLGSQFGLQWTANVFQHLLRLPQGYFLKRHLGDIVSRFGAVGVIQQALTTRFVEVVLDGLMAILTLVMLLLYSPSLTGVTLTGIVAYGCLRALYYRVFRERSLRLIELGAKQSSQFMESVRGVQTLRLFNQVPAHTARYMNAATEALNAGVSVQRYSLAFSAVQGLISGAQRIGVLWLGALLALKGQFSAGMLMAYVAYGDQFAGRASSLIDYVIELRLLRIQGERLADIVLTPTETDTEGTYVGPMPEPSLAFDRVSFRYAAGEPLVVKDCSLEIKAGESIAIAGPSGCGKSTLARLALGLLDPDEGRIRVGGIQLTRLGKQAFRQMIGSVMQDDQLLSGSIADNISFFDVHTTYAQIEDAARQAQIHDDIIAMPMGYHTLVGDMGSSLSGGQRQRLLLARALYRKPSILVLDEATSHLDVACEMRVNDVIRDMRMTRIVIAHRPETIAAAQRVLTFHDGKLREISRHPDSINLNSSPCRDDAGGCLDG